LRKLRNIEILSSDIEILRKASEIEIFMLHALKLSMQNLIGNILLGRKVLAVSHLSPPPY
jgi:hypothetical protein